MGKIFAIEEFSVFDGPGVRLSVFLKGCPLRCTWCHNPEGQRAETEILRRQKGCSGCGACLRASEKKSGVSALTKESVDACPHNLLRVCGEELTAKELVARLEGNLPLLAAVGGGVTFSGGEPLLQGDFLTECLVLLKGRTHRAVQTCGFASAELFGNVLEECDYILYDLKLISPVLHRKYTGVSNERILANYRTLTASDTEFITRIPLIPGVTDTVENITATALLLQECAVKHAELLPYNRAAGAKYALTGRQYEPCFDEHVLPCPHTEIFEKHGIEVRIL